MWPGGETGRHKGLKIPGRLSHEGSTPSSATKQKKGNYMFKLTHNLIEVGEYDTFDEAFIEMYHRVKKDVEQGTSWLLIETACWIEAATGELMMFYEARDAACRSGLLVDGKLNPKRIKEGKYYE